MIIIACFTMLTRADTCVYNVAVHFVMMFVADIFNIYCQFYIFW